MDNHVRYTLRRIRNQLEELDDFLLVRRWRYLPTKLGSTPALTDDNDRHVVGFKLADVLEQIDSLIDRTPFSYREPVKESDDVCCS